jgi:hypothetical protein
MQFISVCLIRLSKCCCKPKLNVSPDDSERGTGTGTVTTPIGSSVRTSVTEENEVFVTPLATPTKRNRNRNPKPETSCCERLARFFEKKENRDFLQKTALHMSNNLKYVFSI